MDRSKCFSILAVLNPQGKLLHYGCCLPVKMGAGQADLAVRRKQSPHLIPQVQQQIRLDVPLLEPLAPQVARHPFLQPGPTLADLRQAGVTIRQLRGLLRLGDDVSQAHPVGAQDTRVAVHQDGAC
jgi:hypothetical protein